MKFRSYSSVQDAILQKKGVEKFLEKAREEAMVGELQSFGTNGGNSVCNKIKIPLFQDKILDTYSTVRCGTCYVHEVDILCVDTGYKDIYNRTIYYSPEVQKLFKVVLYAGDGWELGSITIKEPVMISDADLQEYEQWKQSCKEYNHTVFSEVAKIFGIDIRELYKLKKEGYTTKDIKTAGECIKSFYISVDKLKKFQHGDFTWDRFTKIFGDNVYCGTLPYTEQTVRMAVNLLGLTGKKDNSFIFANKGRA